MSAHTPGPLYPRKNTAGMWEICVEDRDYSHSTAFVTSPNEHAEADARLYAAAPDLLAALERCVIKLGCYRERHGETYIGGVAVEYEAVIAIARAAIAKATGSAT